MRTILSTLSLLALGLWLGAIVFFAIVAAVAFGSLPQQFSDQAAGIHAAGLVVGGAIVHLHYFGIGLGIVFIVLSLILKTMVRWYSVIPQLVLVLAMLLITCYSQFSIIPRMDTARAAAGGEIAAVAQDNPARQVFNHLHQLSTNLELIVLVCGFAAFLLAGRAPAARLRTVPASAAPPSPRVNPGPPPRV
jgi:4-amino-4-deoxy-L-arabinose transferase-like glycosyltransferase